MSDRALGKLVQVFAVLAVVGLVAAASALAWIAVALHGFSGDVAISRERLPATVPKLLPAGQNMLDAPQVTLVRYSQGVSRGAAVLLFTAPDRAQVSFVTLPPSTSLGSRRLEQMDVPALVHSLDRIAGVRVAHVALIDPTAVGPLVGKLGGVNVTNPTPFTATANGRSYTFGHGRLHLDETRAAAFAHVTTSQEPLEMASVSLLGGVVHRLLQPTSVERMRAIGSSLADAASTDLSDADMLGLVELRLRGGTALQCLVPRRSSLTAPPAVDVLARAAGDRPATAGGGCRMRSIPSAAVTPPLVVVRLAQRYGWSGFAAGSGAALLLAAACAGLLWWRWPRQRRRVSIWPPLQVPADGADVVWSQQPPAAAQPPATAPAAADRPAQEPAEPSPAPVRHRDGD